MNKSFLFNEAILRVVRYFFKLIIFFRCKVSFNRYFSLNYFFEIGKDEAAKGEGWALPFISRAQDTVGF